MEPVHGSMLLVYAIIAIALLILLITRYKVYPFLVLIIVSLLLGLAVGMPMDKIVKAFETGNGNTLGHIAIVVGLGTMLGKMMAESGGAERIANTLIGWFGEKYIHWAMMFVAIIVGLPVFFEVGFVLLISHCVQRRETHEEVAAADRFADGRRTLRRARSDSAAPCRAARGAGVSRGH